LLFCHHNADGLIPFGCYYGTALAVHVAALVDIKILRRSLVTSIPICRMVRKELKDSSDSLSASRSLTASVRISVTHARPRPTVAMNSRPAGYAMAKLIIKLISSVAEVINHDPEVKQHIKVFLLRDYNSRSDKKSIPRPT